MNKLDERYISATLLMHDETFPKAPSNLLHICTVNYKSLFIYPCFAVNLKKNEHGWWIIKSLAFHEFDGKVTLAI